MKNTIILLTTLALAMFFALPCAAQDFQSGDLLYEIISEDPPEVTVAGHVDGQDAQGELNIPATVTFEGTEYTVAEISYFAFSECHGLSGTLTFPPTVRSIGEYAFYGCDGLSGQLVFPNSLSVIRCGAFSQCTGLNGTLAFPESVTEVGENSLWSIDYYEHYGAFDECLGFDRLELPASLRYIGPRCFAGCANMTGTLSLPEGITTIESNAFEGCSGFNGTLALPESMETVMSYAFQNCTGFESLVLPSRFVLSYSVGNNTQYSYGAFQGCTGLSHVVIPEGWEDTGAQSFQNCTSLTAVSLPESLRIIREKCFHGCTSLSEINLPDEMTEIRNDAFFGCVSLTAISLPKSLTLLGDAFRGCSGLTGEIVVPDLVEEVTLMTFEGCTGLKRVILGSSVNLVYEAAFNDTNLESLVIRAETPPRLERGNYPHAWDFPADLPIIVPCGTLEAYQNAEGWNEFSNISEGNTFLLKVLANDEHKGSVTITKEPVCGDMDVVLEATPMEGNSFLYWEVNGETVSTDNPYRFELVQDTEFTAVFSADYESDFLDQIGSEWYYEILNDDGSITYQHLEYVADTTFDNKEVKIIIRNNTLYDKSRRDAVTKEYLYEENNIVYWWNATIEQFTVLYDFGAQQGDEWEIRVGAETLTMHVDAVEQYEYEGRVFKMMRVSDPENLFSGMIICGIGHLTSFFPEKLMNPGKAYRVEGIRCFWQQGELVFKYGEKDCEEVYVQYHSSLPEITIPYFTLSPNPTDGLVIVEMSSETSQPGEFRVTNLTGQTLLTGSLTCEKQIIDLSGLPRGVYFLTINNRTQKMIRQ